YTPRWTIRGPIDAEPRAGVRFTKRRNPPQVLDGLPGCAAGSPDAWESSVRMLSRGQPRPGIWVNLSSVEASKMVTDVGRAPLPPTIKVSENSTVVGVTCCGSVSVGGTTVRTRSNEAGSAPATVTLVSVSL